MLGEIRGEVRFKEPLSFHTSLRIGGTADIFVMNADGTGARDLTNSRSVDDYQPAWSPAGIAFRSTRGGVDAIYKMRPDGSHVTRLTQSTGGETDPGWWVLTALRRIGLVWNVKTPDVLPHRANLVPLTR